MEFLSKLLFINIFIVISECQYPFNRRWSTTPPSKVYLLESNNTAHRDLNRRFCSFIDSSQYTCTRYYSDFIFFYSIVFETLSIGGFEDTIHHCKTQKALNLRVHDFFTNNFNKIRNNRIKYIIDEKTVIKKDSACAIKKDSTPSKPCELVENIVNNAVVASDFVYNDEYLMNVITVFLERGSSLAVLVCEFPHNDIKINMVNAEVIYAESTDICSKEIQSLGKNLIMVLTKTIPSPRIYTGAPIIIHKIETRINEEERKRYFPNAIYPKVIMQSTKKIAIKQFILEMKWQRVGIISDKHISSHNFLQELTQIFKENNIFYREKQCDQLNRRCYFQWILKYFKSKAVRIFVANVEANSVETLLREIENENMINSNYVWIFRTTPQKINLLYSTKGAVYVDFEEVNYKSAIEQINYYSFTRFLNTLNFNDDDNEIYRIIKNKVEEQFKKVYASVNIVTNINEKPKVIMKLEIRDNLILRSDMVAHPYEKIPTDIPHCVTRSNNFEDCNDDLLLMLVVVISIFLLFLSIIFLYFDDLKLNNNYSAMD